MDWTKCEWVIEQDGYKGSAYCLMNGRDPYNGKTKAEYEAEGKRVVSMEEFNEEFDKYELSLCGKWKEITEDEYEDMLDVLPPLYWKNGGFFMEEAYTGRVHGFYQKWLGKYYTSLQRITTPREQIIESLCEYIADAS